MSEFLQKVLTFWLHQSESDILFCEDVCEPRHVGDRKKEKGWHWFTIGNILLLKGHHETEGTPSAEFPQLLFIETTRLLLFFLFLYHFDMRKKESHIK